MIAVVEKLSVKMSPLTAPVIVPVKVGLAVLYGRLALLADTVNVALVMVTDPLTYTKL